MRDPGASWERAMRRGRFDRAWRISELVLRSPRASRRDDPDLPYHLRWVWDGRPFEGRHVLVRCYHGLGDTLQFARYLPVLRRSVASLTVEAQPELLGLLATIDGVDRLVPFRRERPQAESDCDLEIMELPFALRMPPERVPARYLRSPRAAVPNGAVGLCWQASAWDPDRSVPADLFRAFTALPCVSLVPGPTALPVVDREGCPPDLDAAAAVVAELDLVITVDTMMAHLAGALGRPTWLLLKHEADWRWMTERTDSPWYPTMRLYRQASPGDWSSVMAEVGRDWRAYVRTRDAAAPSSRRLEPQDGADTSSPG